MRADLFSEPVEPNRTRRSSGRIPRPSFDDTLAAVRGGLRLHATFTPAGISWALSDGTAVAPTTAVGSPHIQRFNPAMMCCYLVFHKHFGSRNDMTRTAWRASQIFS
jgi:hypothetical protein